MPLNVDSLNAGTISQNGEPVKPYKVYTALLTQTGTDAPVATVLENTLGNLTFSRDFGPGEYGIIIPEGFNVNKTFITGFGNVYGNNITHTPIADGSNVTGYYTFYLYEPDGIIYTYFYDQNFINVDLSFFGNITIPMEIRVYN
jgi:hypothetical protein